MARENLETLTLGKGQNHIVALPGLGSAGYQWILQSADAEIVSVEEILHTADEARGIKQGSLNQRFRLAALAPGRTRIRFAQIRSFAPDRPHATHEIELTVAGDD